MTSTSTMTSTSKTVYYFEIDGVIWERGPDGPLEIGVCRDGVDPAIVVALANLYDDQVRRRHRRRGRTTAYAYDPGDARWCAWGVRLTF